MQCCCGVTMLESCEIFHDLHRLPLHSQTEGLYSTENFQALERIFYASYNLINNYSSMLHNYSSIALGDKRGKLRSLFKKKMTLTFLEFNCKQHGRYLLRVMLSYRASNGISVICTPGFRWTLARVPR